MLCNTEHLNFAVQLPSRLLFQEFWFSRWGKLKQLFYFMFEGVKWYHRKEPLQPIPDVLNLFKVGALKGGFRIDLECLATLGWSSRFVKWCRFDILPDGVETSGCQLWKDVTPHHCLWHRKAQRKWYTWFCTNFALKSGPCLGWNSDLRKTFGWYESIGEWTDHWSLGRIGRLVSELSRFDQRKTEEFNLQRELFIIFDQ